MPRRERRATIRCLLFDNIAVPLTRALERAITPPFGQTVFCVAEKPR